MTPPAGVREAELRVEPMDPGRPIAAAPLRAYMAEVAGRYFQRELGEAELEQMLAEFSSDHLIEPLGLLLVAHDGCNGLGCVGLRADDDEIGQLTRIEARRLYARHGYREVEPFSDDVLAEHWFAKTL